MALAIPRVITNDSAITSSPGGGSLCFSDQDQYLHKTYSLDGNRRRWTCSYWAKVTDLPVTQKHILGAWIDTNNRDNLYYGSGASFHYNMKLSSSWHVDKATDARYRDPGWFHFCHVWDTPQSSTTNRVKTYVNGVDQSWGGGYGVTDPAQNAQSILMADCIHYIGAATENDGTLQAGEYEGYLSQFYWIDGQALAPTDFAYRDRLTNTWRPRPFVELPYKPNTGLSWSGMCSGSTDSGYEASKAFDGSDATSCYPQPGSTVTMTIPAGKLKYYSTFEAWVSRDANGGVITVNGGSDVNVGSAGFQIVDLSGQVAAGADITEITWARAGGGSIGLYMIYIMIDGVPLLDDDDTNFGGRGYYLPFDGRSPIGEDKSGRGNDWTNVKVLNQTTYDKATAGFPILNTVSAGAVGTSGLEEDVTPSTPTGVEGCVAFDGSSDSLFCEDGAGVRFGTDPFTIEGWFYVREHEASVPTIISKYDNGDYSWIIRTWTDDKLTVQTPESGGTNHYSTYTVPVGVWIHFAYVREGTGSNEAHIYVNGTNYGTWTDDNNYDDTNDIYIGRQDVTNTNYFNGFISNIRLVNGTAVYTADFDVPTKPLENITNTKLLCCQSSTMVGAALTAPTMGGLNDGTYWGGQGSSYIGNIWSDPQDTSGSGSFWPGSMFSGQTSGHANNVGPYSSGKLIVDFGKTWEGSTDFIIYGRLYQNDLYKDQDGNTLYTQGSSGSGNIENRSFTASDVSRIIVDAISNNGNSSFIANISVDGEQLRDPLNKLPGSTSNNPVATRSEASGSCIVALPLNANNLDVSNRINPASSTKTATVTGATAKTDYGHFYGSSYYFDGTNDEIVVSDATAFDVENNEFTAECWWNIDSFSGNRRVFSSGNGTSSSHKSHFQLVVTSSGLIRFDYDATAGHSLSTAGDIVVADTWYHTAIQRNLSSGTATMEIYLNGVLTASTTSNASFDMNNTEGVTLGRESTGSNWWQGWIQDFRFCNGVAKYKKNFIPPGAPGGGIGGSASGKGVNYGVLKDSPYGPSYSSFLQPPKDNGSLQLDGNGDYLEFSDNTDFAMSTGDFTVECWVYCNAYGGAYNAVVDCRDATTQATGWILGVSGAAGQGGAGNVYIYNDGFLLESSSGGVPLYKWTHLAYVRSSGRHELYVDGVLRDSDTSSYTYSVDSCQIGASYSNAENWTGWISNVRIVKGRAVYITDFTPPTNPLTNVTDTKLLCCQGNEVGPTGYVVSPGAITANGNISSSKFNPFDGGQSNTDIVLGEPADYCVWNMLQFGSTGSGTYYGGNLRFYGAGTWKSTTGTMAVSSGRWYYEQEVVGSVYGTASGNTAMGFGWTVTDELIIDEGFASGTTQPPRTTSFWNTGGYNNFGAYQGTVCTPATGDVMATALDKDNNTVKYYLNGIEVLSLALGDTTSELVPYCICYYNSSYFETNFGQKPFKFAPPEGYRPLNSSNIALQPGVSSRIVNPSKYFDVVLYEGTGASKGVSGFNFAPDFVWVKRTDGANGQNLFDVLRGPGNYIQSASINQQGTDAAELESFDQAGFTYGGNAGGNASGGNYVSWCWKAGGNKGTFNIDDVAYASAAAAGLSGGHISPTACSINTRAGFSILKYTGNQGNAQNLAHGLGALPDFVVCKNLGTSYNWFIYHSSAMTNGQNAGLYFTDAAMTTGYGTQPFGTFTTEYLNFGNNDGVNGAYDYICYAWKNVPGLQKFGKYTGNNSGDNGPFIYLGFKPALVVIKRVEATGKWNVQDYRRTTYNGEATTSLQWDNNNSEATIGSGYERDQLSNGFRLRNGNTETNASGSTYIYMAWAKESVGSMFGGQSTGRGEV